MEKIIVDMKALHNEYLHTNSVLRDKYSDCIHIIFTICFHAIFLFGGGSIRYILHERM